MTDTETVVAELKDLVAGFVREREWERFHTPKNLSMAIAIEAAELMEHFQWETPESSWELVRDPGTLRAVSLEIADVVIYALSLCNRLQIDLATTIAEKLRLNAQKYPKEQYRGRY
jgi:NTP pyrophosphatase (non-canonical NTP hydrolase)